jgi:predicted ATPase
LVTLTGVGGCGKTRLALAAAAELVDRFADGVFLVELAAVSDPTRVAEVVAAALGLSLAGGSGRASVAGFLARRDVLIVLDNCEHLLDEVAAFVDEMLAAAPNARVLATSREALDVDGEQSHRVSSLDGASALALLFERAAEASDTFVADGTDEAAALELCERLDGIPLAIELAAAHSCAPVTRCAARSSRSSLRVARGQRPPSPATPADTQAVMEWSWELLDDDERRVLAAGGVHRRLDGGARPRACVLSSWPCRSPRCCDRWPPSP